MTQLTGKIYPTWCKIYSPVGQILQKFCTSVELILLAHCSILFYILAQPLVNFTYFYLGSTTDLYTYNSQFWPPASKLLDMQLVTCRKFPLLITLCRQSLLRLYNYQGSNYSGAETELRIRPSYILWTSCAAHYNVILLV